MSAGRSSESVPYRIDDAVVCALPAEDLQGALALALGVGLAAFDCRGPRVAEPEARSAAREGG